MKKCLKIILAILIFSLILAAAIIPIISSFSYLSENEKSPLDITWYYDSSDGVKEVEIPNRIDTEKNETCTIYAYFETDKFSDQAIVIRTSYQKLNIYIDDTCIYTFDTDSYRPYGKANPSKIHYVSLPEDLAGKKISISVTSPYSQYSGYFSNIDIGDYETVINNLYLKYNVELIFGIFITMLSLFLLISNAIVVKFSKASKSVFYIFGATLLLGVWMIFDSKFINLFINEFIVSQVIFISLQAFAIMFALFIDSKSTKHTKGLVVSIFVLSILNIIGQNILHILNVMDYVEMLFISLGLIFVEILLFLINMLISNKRKAKPDRLEVFISILLILFFICNIYLLTYTFVTVNTILGIIFTMLAITTHYKTIYHISEEAERSKELKSKLSQTQNYLIQSQMKPHFIFNTLGAIRTMIKSSPDRAYELTTSFSKYLRANISNISPDETISFAQEMDHIYTYVEIEKARFGERLNVVYDIKTNNFNMPPLTVEPLVENAVKHGVCKKIKGGTVKISSWEESDRFIVTVEDDGVGFDTDKRSESNGSVGLKYIELRLKEISNADFMIESKVGVGTKATLTFFKEK